MITRTTLLLGALICALSPFNTRAQGSCNCPDGEVEIQIEWLQSTTTNQGGESWELVNQDGVMLVSGGPYFNAAECISAQDVLTVYGYDSDGSGWSGSSLRFQTQLGSTFNTFSPGGSFGSQTFVPEIDGYITPLSGTCVYEIRDEFGNTVWHSGYSGNCSQKQCQIPAGQFELFTFAGTSMAIQLEKIVGFAPGQGVIYNDTFNIPSPDLCNGCARSGLLPTCNCGILDSDSDLICDNIDDCIGEVDECGVCQGTGIPDGFCDCFGNQPDAIGICGGDCDTDQDGDEICDDVDDCIGQYDECGICNGSGIPAGDCDCLGHTLDAIGVCGGDCTADTDNDQVCDDIDDCVGELDACGICNGPGPIYACGCETIPDGYCDCNGNQTDAIGVCGGNCTSDTNGDGVCDDVIYGCMDPDACTFNPNATLPNETCLYIDECGECGGNNTCVGCLEPAACNFNPSATISNAECDYCSCYSLPSIGVLQWGIATLSQGQLSTVGFWTENNMIPPPYDETLTRMECGDHGCAATTADGRLVTWGYGAVSAELTFTTPVKNFLPVPDGYLILLEDGSFETNGNIPNQISANLPEPEVAALIRDWQVGGNAVIAQLEDNSIIGWGTFGGGYSPTPPNGLQAEVFAAADRFATAIDLDGNVVHWGNIGDAPCCGLTMNADAIFLTGQSGFVSYSYGGYATWGSHWEDNYYNGNYSSLPSEMSNQYFSDVQFGSNGTAFLTLSGELFIVGNPDILGTGTTYPTNTLDECGVCNGPGIPEGDCDCDGSQLDAIGVCGGTCAADIDEDGVCDSAVPGCIDTSACNFDPNATDDDGSCLTNDAIGVCGGNCAEDADGDGICDDIDPCIGTVDACGVCNGPGAIYQCGCTPLQESECDCFGNILDECGVCGGDGTTCGAAPCLDENDALAPLGGCANAVSLLGCDALWDGLPLSSWCQVTCENCPCESDFNNNGVCDDEEVFGCTYVLASNYSSSATSDDGSCILELSDTCPTDIDNDGLVGVGDILIVLSTYGGTCSE